MSHCFVQNPQSSYPVLPRHAAMANPLSRSEALLHIANHVCLPPKLPEQALSETHERQIELKLTRLVVNAVEQYRSLVTVDTDQWLRMSRMLSCVAQNVEFSLEKNQLQKDLINMEIGGACEFVQM
jgi:hypothetical protein